MREESTVVTKPSYPQYLKENVRFANRETIYYYASYKFRVSDVHSRQRSTIGSGMHLSKRFQCSEGALLPERSEKEFGAVVAKTSASSASLSSAYLKAG